MRMKQVPQTSSPRLTFEILDDHRVVMRVARLAHLSVVHRLGRIYALLHEVQQLRPIPLGSIRVTEQGGDLVGNDNSFRLFRCAGRAGLHLQRPDLNASNASEAATRSPD